MVKEKYGRLWRKASGARWVGERWSDDQKTADDELGSAKISSFFGAAGRPLDFYRIKMKIKAATCLTFDKNIYLQLAMIALIWHSYVHELGLGLGVDSYSAFKEKCKFRTTATFDGTEHSK